MQYGKTNAQKYFFQIVNVTLLGRYFFCIFSNIIDCSSGISDGLLKYIWIALIPIHRPIVTADIMRISIYYL